MPVIAEWLAGKVSGLIIFGLACAAPILLIGCIWLNVELNGIALGSWHIVDGAIHKKELAEKDRDQARSDLATARVNVATLDAGLTRCNASVAALKVAGDQRVKDAQQKVDQANSRRRSVEASIAAIRAVKSTGEKCPAVDEIIMRGFE